MTYPSSLLAALRQLQRREIVVKESGPEYRRIVAELQALLVADYSDRIAELPDVVAELAAIGEMGGRKRDRIAAAHAKLAEVARRLEGHDIPDQVVAGLGRSLAAAYALGQAEVAKPFGFEMDFALRDADAIAGMHDSGLFWIGQFYGDPIGTTARREVLRTLEEGLPRETAAERLREAFGGVVERSDTYWRGFAATVATRARSFGALSSFETIGVTTYEYLNPMDERTSEVCRALDGTVFTVRGSVDLRDRFLATTDPEAAKAVAPWPGVGGVQRADGSALSAGELQAAGVAWPPLHFHCRSSIVASHFGELPPLGDPLGDVELEPRVRKTRTTKPRKPRAKKPADPWTTANAELRAAVTAVKAAGLDSDRYGLSDDLRRELIALRRGIELTKDAPRILEVWGGTAIPNGTSSQLRELLAVLRAEAGAEVLAGRVAQELAVQDALTAAYRRAAFVAPLEWQEKERARWLRKLLTGLPKVVAPDTAAGVHRASKQFGVDLLRLLAAEGETIHHEGRNLRAFAEPGRPGRVVMNLLKCGTERGRVTLAHEIAHRLDGVFAGTGSNGAAWVTRPGYEDAPKVWREAFGDPFDAAKQAAPGNGVAAMVQALPGEPDAHGRHMWRGHWVEQYEARIYTYGLPTEAELREPKYAGPIEFIAMNTQYRAESSDFVSSPLLSQLGTRKGLSLEPETGRVTPRGVWTVLLEAASGDHHEARRIYGRAQQVAMERMFGDGRRIAQELEVTAGFGFRSPQDLAASAALLSESYGTPLEQLVGPAGVWARHVPEGFDAVAEATRLIADEPVFAGRASYIRNRARAMLERIADPSTLFDMGGP